MNNNALNDFAPPGFIQVKENNNYLKITDGDHRIRILSKPLYGWEAFVNNTPVRFPFVNEVTKPHAMATKIMWAVIWNYDLQTIQIASIKSATIQKLIIQLCANPQWGMPYDYDIIITRMITDKNPDGTVKKSAYGVKPQAKSALSKEIIEGFKLKPCYLEALLESKDPWAFHDKVTPLALSVSDATPANKIQPISVAQALTNSFDALVKSKNIDPSYMKQFIGHRTETSGWTEKMIEEWVFKSEQNKNAFVKQYEDFVNESNSEEVPF